MEKNPEKKGEWDLDLDAPTQNTSNPEDFSLNLDKKTEEPKPDFVLDLDNWGDPAGVKSEKNIDTSEDKKFETEAFAAVESGDFDSAMRNALKIKDLELQTSVYWDLTKNLIEQKKFVDARTICDLIKDKEYKERLHNLIDEAQDLWEEVDRDRRYDEWVSKWNVAKDVWSAMASASKEKKESSAPEPLPKMPKAENYKVNQDAVDYLNQLIDDNVGGIKGAMLGVTGVSIDKARSEEEALEIAKNLLSRRFINEAQYRVLTAYVKGVIPLSEGDLDGFPEEKKLEKKDGRVNQKVFDVMSGLAAKIKKDEVEEFKELREEISQTNDADEALSIISKYSISIPGPERKKIMACFGKSKETKVIAIKKPEAKTSFVTPSTKVEKSKEVIGDLDYSELGKARLAYLEAKIDYQKKTHEHVGKFKSIMASLGIIKTKEDFDQLSSPVIFDAKKEMEAARAEYIKVKKLMRDSIISGAISSHEYAEFDPTGESQKNNFAAVEGAIITWKLLEYAEKESESLEIEEQRLAKDGGNETINKIRESAAKAFAIWNKVPSKQRLVAKSILLGAAAGATGGLAAGAFVAGSSLVKGAAGMIGGIGAGKTADYFFDKTNKKAQSEREGQFIDESLSYEEREKAYMEKREKELSTKKKQKVVKAMAMVGAGAGAGIAAGLAESYGQNYSSGSTERVSGVGAKNIPESSVPKPQTETAPSSSPVAPSNQSPESITNTRPDTSEEAPETKSNTEVPPEETKTARNEVIESSNSTTTYGEYAGPADVVTTEAAANAEYHAVLPINVELSSKGFLQDIIDLKQKLRVSPYEITDEMKKNLMDKTPMEIAKEYGMYKADGNLSGMSMKGGHLGVDAEGRLVYEYQGKSSTMYDYENNKVKTFEEIGGKMFTPKVAVEVPADLKADEGVTEQNSDQVEYKTELGEGNGDLEGSEVVGDEGVVGENENPVAHDAEGADRVEDGYESPVPRPPVPEGYTEDLKITTETSGDMFFQGKQIAHETVFNGHKIPALDDKYMEGPENGDVRMAFLHTYSESIDKTEVFGENHIAVPFDVDGKSMIDIANKIPGKENDITVFLNGKKIAEGAVTERGASIRLLTEDPTIKHHGLMGWLMPDTVYERAFKEAKKIVESELTKFYVK